MWIFGILILIALAATLLYRGRTKMGWILPVGLALGWWGVAGGFDSAAWKVVTVFFVLDAIILGVPSIRQVTVTGPIMKALARVLPGMSDTERIALEAGTVWWDGDLFSGAPDWSKWLRNAPPRLSDRERVFLEGPCQELCAMVDDWDVTTRGDLPPEVWDFIRKHRFMAMIIPESYGGLGFSAQMHSEVVAKLSSHSPALAVTVMVPNSLGPGELLLHYGTEDQKNHYLPRLASADEIPCFALTEPNAGSDAGSMRSYGVIQRGTFEGKDVLGMRLNWDKRYITLAPVATLIGLAFRLFDPEHLLGNTEDLGITVALIPANTPGITHGERHDPLGVSFMNGPTQGEDVFVPLDYIIGGSAMAGQGWMMLMQSLSAGRGISLPSLSAGALQLATRSASAYASVREQFGLPIGRFEGIQEALARVAGLTYAIDAVRTVTAASVDGGEKPSVVSAIAKAYSTDSMRRGITDAVDIFGGSGICLGPRNILARTYKAAPIGITVEGANILTRTMIIFGQGAMRCHPFIRREVEAIAENDRARFDGAFFGHVGFAFRNVVRAKLLMFTDGRLEPPPITGPTSRYFQKLSRMSAAFALCADLAVGTLGGELKRKEKLTGRLADALAWLYIGSAVLKRYVDEGQQDVDRPYAEWALQHALCEIQTGLIGFLDNLPNRPAAVIARMAAFTFGPRYQPPSDRLGARVARGVLEDGPARRRLTRALFVPDGETPGLGQLEDALGKVMAARPVMKIIAGAVRAGTLDRRPAVTLIERAETAGVITGEQRALAEAAMAARERAIAVDAFPSPGSPSEASGSSTQQRAGV